MRFTWDERKRKANLRDHGFDFADARRVFEGFTTTYEDDRFSYGEQRFVTGRNSFQRPGYKRSTNASIFASLSSGCVTL